MRARLAKFTLIVFAAAGLACASASLGMFASIVGSDSAFAAKKQAAHRSTSRPARASRRSSGSHRTARSSTRRSGNTHVRRSGGTRHATSHKTTRSVTSRKTTTRVHSTARPSGNKSNALSTQSHVNKGHSNLTNNGGKQDGKGKTDTGQFKAAGNNAKNGNGRKLQNFQKGHANLGYKKQNKGHSSSKGGKPNYVKHKDNNKVGKLGNKHNHKATVVSHNGHFYRRHYYSWLVGGVLGWYFYDDLVAPGDPDIVALAEVPVCATDDTDDCNPAPIASIPVQPVAAVGVCEAVVYSKKDFQGDTVIFTEDQPYVGDDWNDTISSLEAKSGKWEFFQDPDYGGDRVRLFAPHTLSLDDRWAGKISSARCIP